MIINNRVTVNGVMIYPFASISQLITHVGKYKGILVAINAEKILYATDETRNIINHNIGYCDGVGAVMALNKKGYEVTKIPGCELWLHIIDALYAEGKTFYLVGSKQEVVEATVEKLRKEKAGINIIAYRNGYIKSDEEKHALLNDIAAKKPDVVFVAMGSPKQELLMEEMQKLHPAIYQGLGGSFDVYVGRVKRAPEWWVNHSLEWLYRLINEPSRIKRQIFLIPFFLKLKMGRL